MPSGEFIRGVRVAGADRFYDVAVMLPDRAVVFIIHLSTLGVLETEPA
ncbi:hypothetical protein NKH28_31950 [Mesorhizobium sp. M1227]